MTPLDAMKQALEALESCIHDPRMRHTDIVHYEVVDAGRMLSKAIDELESAEPVAWQCKSKTRIATEYVYDKQSAKNAEQLWTVTPLFTLPAQSRDSIIEECAVNAKMPTYKELLDFASEEEFLLFCSRDEVLDIMLTTIQKYCKYHAPSYKNVELVKRLRMCLNGWSPNSSIYITIKDAADLIERIGGLK